MTVDWDRARERTWREAAPAAVVCNSAAGVNLCIGTGIVDNRPPQRHSDPQCAARKNGETAYQLRPCCRIAARI